MSAYQDHLHRADKAFPLPVTLSPWLLEHGSLVSEHFTNATEGSFNPSELQWFCACWKSDIRRIYLYLGVQADIFKMH